jgi:hypothetical protein|nr:MAG TPA: hypothetical protein [Caudoviricetes sp.]
MLLNLTHEERIGKFIQYFLENGFDKVALEFDGDADGQSTNYLIPSSSKNYEIIYRFFEFMPDGDIIEQFSDGGYDYVDNIYPATQQAHPQYQKVVAWLHELGDKVEKVEFYRKPVEVVVIYLSDGTEKLI